MFMFLCQPKVSPHRYVVPDRHTCQIVIKRCTKDGCGIEPMKAPPVKISHQ